MVIKHFLSIPEGSKLIMTTSHGHCRWNPGETAEVRLRYQLHWTSSHDRNTANSVYIATSKPLTRYYWQSPCHHEIFSPQGPRHKLLNIASPIDT